MKDIRYAFRQLRKKPGFAAVVIATLGLGIGATTAIFSVVDAVLLRSLPVREPDRLVVAWQEDRARDFEHFPFYYATYEAARERSRALAEVAALPRWGTSRWTVAQNGEILTVGGTVVTGEFFGVLGARPAAGRLLEPADDVRGTPLAVVLSHGLWQRAFGGDPKLVGRTIEVVGRSGTIVGVAPEGFDYPRGADVWVPALSYWNPDAPGGIDPHDRFVELDLVARLAPGATRAQARAELAAIAAESRAERDIDAPAGLAVVVESLTDVVVGDVRPALLMITAAVALVLLIAGVNVANLLVVRGLERRREFALRVAMGADRRRIVRQLLTETVVLALAGGLLGILLAAWGLRSLPALAPPELPLGSVGIDIRVLGFAVCVSLIAATLFGLLPALGVTSVAPARTLGSGDRTPGPTGGARRARHALVVGQIALTLVVLAGAGLLLNSLARLHALDPGYRPERLTLMSIAVPPGEYEEREEHLALFDRLLERVRALPGVAAATGVVSEPFSGVGGIDIIYTAEGEDEEAAASNPWLNYEGVGPGYFRALGLPIVRGRGFTARDREGALPVVVVNEALARLGWPGEEAVGKRIRLGGADLPWRTVVGVAADARYRTFEEVRPSVYVPFRQGIPVRPHSLLVRAHPGANVVPAARGLLAEIDPDLAILSARPMEDVLDQPLARPRFQTLLLGLLAGLGLILSTIGIYGVVSHTVAARTREIGVRMALGANRRSVLRTVLRGAAALIGTGIVLGLMGAAVGTRLLRGLLFQIGPLDPATFAGVTLVLAMIALLASWLPARRAMRVDPVDALRAE